MSIKEQPGESYIDPEEFERMSVRLREIGLDIEKIRPDIVSRLALLDQSTKVVEDEHNAIHLARAVFDWYRKNKPGASWVEREERAVVIGTMFSDIGKTGFRTANIDQQKLIVAIYSIDSKDWGGGEDKLSVVKYLEKYFPEDYVEKVRIYVSTGLDPEMVMRKFWDMHAEWTLQIISGDGVPPEAVVAAASHHFIQGINPEGIIGNDGRFTRYFGENLSFDRVEKLICVLDVYDAFRRRSHMSHDQAITALRKKVDLSESFSGDKGFHELIDVVDFTNRETHV
ncbi:MAG: hypothetical protein UT43_C0034G0005 [Parcubacteria group bacterium GW2011_GWC1_39_29]|nr:MAG: hypothetical protein UT43_C0034G0005 [Parcubacteria group bacterium GW2011_GWC1_39_29]